MRRTTRSPRLRHVLPAALTLWAAVVWPSAAPGAGVAWTSQFGTRYPDDANGLTIDRAGNLYVVGQTSGELPDQKAAGMIDGFVRRYNPAGQEVWTRQFGSPERDLPKGVAVEPGGDVYVVGQTFGSLPGQTSAGGWDGFLRRYSPSGDEVWTRQFGGGGGESAASVRVDAAGNAYVVGGTRAALPGQTNIGDYDAFIIKFDAAGALLWVKQHGTTVEDYAVSVVIDGQGNPIMAGETSGLMAGAGRAGGLDGFVRQYDPEGNVMWTRQFGSSMDDFAVGTAVGPDGNVHVVGTTFGSLPGQTSKGKTDGFVTAFNPHGAGLWMRQFGTPGSDDAEAIAFDPSGGMFIAGRAGGALHGGAASGGTDAFLAATNPGGDFLWVHQFGGAADDYGLGLAIGQTGVFVAGGTIGALAGETNIGERDAFVVSIS
ncbi:MAG TPA: SBBP repeat-containing protein [Acidimicrobiia bacterium]|nr:SBBP repeat-containing protein [Acidimicrobiia bacterium]